MKRTVFLAGLAAIPIFAPLLAKAAPKKYSTLYVPGGYDMHKRAQEVLASKFRPYYPGEPSLRPHLSEQVIVKYDAWKHWRDAMTGEDLAYYKIRFAVVPSKFSDISFDRTKPYMTILETVGDIEKIPFTYMFGTYSSDMAVGKTQVEELKESVHDGTVMLKYRIPGTPIKRNPTEVTLGRPFLEMIAVMENYANDEYERINGTV